MYINRSIANPDFALDRNSNIPIKEIKQGLSVDKMCPVCSKADK
jgi:hypothetical protein